MACRLVGAEALSEPIMEYYQGTYFSETLSKIQKFSVKEMHLKMSSAKWRSFCLGFNVLSARIISSNNSSNLLACITVCQHTVHVCATVSQRN